jgi:hypothetical protein
MGSRLHLGRKWGLVETFSFAVVIRSAFARGYGATGETLNRYIGGERKRDPTMDFAWYREFVTRNNNLVAHKPRGWQESQATRPPLQILRRRHACLYSCSAHAS